MELGGVFASSYLSRLARTRRPPASHHQPYTSTGPSPTSPVFPNPAHRRRSSTEVDEVTDEQERVAIADWERRTERWMPYFGGRRGDWRKGSLS